MTHTASLVRRGCFSPLLQTADGVDRTSVVPRCSHLRGTLPHRKLVCHGQRRYACANLEVCSFSRSRASPWSSLLLSSTVCLRSISPSGGIILLCATQPLLLLMLYRFWAYPWLGCVSTCWDMPADALHLATRPTVVLERAGAFLQPQRRWGTSGSGTIALWSLRRSSSGKILGLSIFFSTLSSSSSVHVGSSNARRGSGRLLRCSSVVHLAWIVPGGP